MSKTVASIFLLFALCLSSGAQIGNPFEVEAQLVDDEVRVSATVPTNHYLYAENFTVSDARRTAVENRLISAALEAFKERARIVGDNLQATGFRVVELNVNSGGQRPPVVYQARMASAMESDTAVAVAGGETDVVVTVNGTIELLMP